jgi:twitching motility protein PilI
MNANVTSKAPAVTVATLRSLRDKPFELLRELERLARVALSGQGRDADNEREWVGVAFRMSSENFLVAREETREVLGFPSVVTRVPGAKPWIRGLANVRGQLLPIVDLRAYLGGGMTNISRASRVLVANHREVPAGLLVDEVQGFRRFADNEFGATVPPTIIRCERYLAGAFRRGADSWPVFSLRSLLESTEFVQAAAS